MVCSGIAVAGDLEGDVAIINVDLCDGEDCPEGKGVLASIIPEGRAQDLILLQPAVESLVSGPSLVHCSPLGLGVGGPPVYVFRRDGPGVSMVSFISNNHLKTAKVALQLALEDAQVAHLSTGEGAVEGDNIASLDADGQLVPETSLFGLVAVEAGINIIVPGPGFLDGAVCSIHSDEATIAGVSGVSVLPADLNKKKKSYSVKRSFKRVVVVIVGEIDLHLLLPANLI